jgi:hypothetical protein
MSWKSILPNVQYAKVQNTNRKENVSIQLS